MEGRHYRALVGTIVIVVDVAAFAFTHLIQSAAYTWQEVGAHIAFLIVGLLLVDPTSGKEVLGKVAERVPFVGKRSE